MKPTPCDLTGQPGRPPKAPFAQMLKRVEPGVIPTVEVHEPLPAKGSKRVTVTSPNGARITHTGVCLWVARADDSGRHHTVHERGESGELDTLVAIVPDDWALELERNQ